jgi:hypothetical protein
MKIEIINTTDKNRYNCVKYARSRYSSLPYGLWTLRDKTKIINSFTPKMLECVAIIDAGFWGHIAIVVEFTGDEHNPSDIVIEEANYLSGKITRRSGTPKELKILGYFI